MAIRSSLPRSLWPLLAVLLVAILALIFLRGEEDDSDFTLGGRVFPVAAEDIRVMHLTRNNADYRFERVGPGAWSLSGSASDYVDAQAMNQLVSFLVSVEGGRILPGTSAEDKRYGFDGNKSIRLVVYATQEREFRLVLGVENPVTAGVYASGAGRPGCFPVGQGLRNKLRALPVSVQEAKILPPFDVGALTEIEVWRGSEKLTLQHNDSRWWISEPRDGLAQLGISFRNYDAVYKDRRRVIDGKSWLLADPRSVEKLIYESSQVPVRDIVSPAITPEKREEWSLEPSWRKIVFHGNNINGDPAARSPHKFALSYGPPFEESYVPLMRRGNLLLGDIMAAGMLGQPLGKWLDTGAMPFLVEIGDSLYLEKEGRRMVSAYPGTDADVSRWVGVLPDPQGVDFSERQSRNVVENFITNLDRLEIIQVFPPSDKAWILEDNERVELIFWTSEEGIPGRHSVEFGWLDLEHLTEADRDRATKLAEEYDGQRPAGLWVPGTGKFIQIPAHIIISFRSLEKN